MKKVTAKMVRVTGSVTCDLCSKKITSDYLIYDDKTNEYYHLRCFQLTRKRKNPMTVTDIKRKEISNNIPSEIFAEHLMMALDMPVTKPTKSQLHRWKRYKRYGDPFCVSREIREKSFADGRII